MSKYTLIGVNGNAFSVMGYVTKAMRNEGLTKEEIAEYQDKAMGGNYSNLLKVSQEVVNKLNEGEDTDE